MSKCPMCGTPATFEIRLPEGASIPCASLTEANGLLRTHQRQWPNEDLSIGVVASPNTDYAYALECRAALEKAYRELNEIHARDGVPYTSNGWKSSVTQEYFTSVVEECRNVLAKNPNPSGQGTAEASLLTCGEASGPVGLGPSINAAIDKLLLSVPTPAGPNKGGWITQAIVTLRAVRKRFAPDTPVTERIQEERK